MHIKQTRRAILEIASSLLILSDISRCIAVSMRKCILYPFIFISINAKPSVLYLYLSNEIESYESYFIQCTFVVSNTIFIFRHFVDASNLDWSVNIVITNFVLFACVYSFIYLHYGWLKSTIMNITLFVCFTYHSRNYGAFVGQ